MPRRLRHRPRARAAGCAPRGMARSRFRCRSRTGSQSSVFESRGAPGPNSPPSAAATGPKSAIRQAPRVEAAAPHREEELRVSSIELFFDLVFVFTITQLTALLAAKPNGEALAQVVLMLSAIWWMYGAFAWLTNAVPPDRTALRLPLLGGMLAFFAISLAIPTAFTENGVVFACAYLVVIAVHTVLYMQSASWTVAGVWSFARMNVVAGMLILVGAIIGGAAEYALWGLAVAIFAITPALVPEEAGWIRPSHFVERHGLVVMVALGESVVAVGIGASGLDITWQLLAVAT